jgi:hypothetical protein
LRRIRKGTTIMEYIGDRVSHEEADARYENKHPDDNHTFLFTVDSRTVIDGGIGGNDARYINHGCDPNCESASQDKRIYVEAIKTIQAGEELAYDYQIGRDPEDPPNVDQIFACRCGADKCRGSMLVPPKVRAQQRKRKSPARSAKKHAEKTVKRSAEKSGKKSMRKSPKKRSRAAGRRSAAAKSKSRSTKASVAVRRDREGKPRGVARFASRRRGR